MRHARRGTMLTQVVVMVPLVATIGAISFELVAKGLRFEALATRQMEADAAFRALVQRIQQDCAQASNVSLDRGSRGAVLRLEARGGGSPMVYRVGPDCVVRSAEVDGLAAECKWSLRADRAVDFVIEDIGGRPRVVWILLTTTVLTDQGPPIVRRESAGALVGGMP